MQPSVADTVYTERKFAEGFAEKYTGTEFVYEKKAAAKTQWERFKEWLGRTWEKIFGGGGDSSQSSVAVNWIIRIVAFLIVGFVIYLIVMALLNKESMWIFGKSRKNISVSDITGEDIRQTDFRQLIADTKNSGNHRLAVRYYYLWLLKKLSQRETINWHADKTNSDYAYEIKDPLLRKDFQYLSYLYEYSWYGEFPIDEAAFGKAEKAFLKTLNTL